MQEDATNHVIKRAKREWPPELKLKGNQEEFINNRGVADHINAAARKLQKLAKIREKERRH